MAIERLNQAFIEVTCEGGLRTIVKIASINVAAECDPTGGEISLVIGHAQRFQVIASIDELREALLDEPASYSLRRSVL